MKLRWNAWNGDCEFDFTFPISWKVTRASMYDAEECAPKAIEQALDSPFDSPPLKDLASRTKSAVIVVEDITRPTPTAEILPFVLSRLRMVGVKDNQVRIVMGLGAHAPMTHGDLEMKLGREVIENIEVFQHNCFDNLVDLGKTKRGTPILISKVFHEGELKIGMGSITPHPFMGFGGGVKIVAVGVAGLDTLTENHRRAMAGERGPIGILEGNQSRDDLDEIAQRVGFSFVVDGLVNSQRKLAAVFAGDPISAHQIAAKHARQVYATPTPPPADVAIFNAYPKDTDFIQVGNAFNVYGGDPTKAIKTNGSIVVITASPHGQGFHYWSGVNGRVYSHPGDKSSSNQPRIVYSPTLSRSQVHQIWPSDTLVFNHWEDVISELVRRHGNFATVNVFPCASLQLCVGI